ncbi:MAG TPA: bifunctional ornithine acetyltransferase/N-acetylglutamate synthase [Methanomicrobia archaeon]|mgnify:CR=1 FL=1|nr:bifunctional ornithine acetyltransferase/N-acetylglutamate synthase [Methanomicrobia archaeon]
MTRIREVDGHIWNVPGFFANGAHCGLKRKRKDFSIIFSRLPCSAAAVYTTNKVFAAPLLVTREHLANGRAQAIICNSGVANACTGTQGLENARTMAAEAARALGCAPEDVIVASTGVIGQQLPMDKVTDAIRSVASTLGTEKGSEAAEGIMTTDTMPKELVVRTKIDGKDVTLGAIAKGSGMICPNMATMLAFVVTDASITPGALSKALSASVNDTYNMISVDGDTSTNDMVAVLANGKAGNETITEGSPDFEPFCDALTYLNEHMSKLIVQDGEGATKVFEVQVKRAPTRDDARLMAKSIVSSCLVKSAVHGGDPNWGRIMCAAGYSGATFDADASQLSIVSGDESIVLFEDGQPTDYDEDRAASMMQEELITFILDAKTGEGDAKAWGCDLTHEYVDINAHYRT